MRDVVEKHTLVHFIFISAVANVALLKEIINKGYGLFFLEKDEPEFYNELVRKIHMAKKLLTKKIDAVKHDDLITKQIDETLKSFDP
jgi:DNA-binding HxlR family transcriptional regulator